MGSPDNRRTPDDVLAHYGVPGQKWGVRRNRTGKVSGNTKVSSLKGKPPKTSKFKKAPVKSPKKMTDQELKKAIDRIQMERKFSQLTKEAPTGKSAVAGVVKDTLLKIGKDQALVYGTKGAVYLIEKSLKAAVKAR